MNEKKKARPTVCAVEQAEMGSVLADCNSHNHFTPNPVAGQLKICELLSLGQENAVPLRHLVMVTGLDWRVVRQMIEKVRRSGTPILSDCQKGYFLAATAAEAQTFAPSMRRRAGEIIKTAQAIEVVDIQQSLKAIKPTQCAPDATTGQMRIEGV